MKYKRDENGNIVYHTDLRGDRIPVPVDPPACAVEYIGFDEENLPDNPSPEALSLIGK